MRTAKKFKTVKLLAGAMAMTSLLAAAPVQAAEKTTEDLRSSAVTNTVTSMAAAGYVTGLESSLIKNESTASVVSSTVKSGFMTVEDKTYYYDMLGQKVVGAHIVDDEEYYFDTEGVMQTGLILEDDKAYFYNEETGVKETGLVEFEGKTYYLNEDNTLKTGWLEEDGVKTAYFNEDGTMRTDSLSEVDGTTYLFDAEGNITKNTTASGYTFDENGVGTPDLSGYDRIYQAAMAQLGVYQDCTMLVTNSLAAVGINFHGWPTDYLSLGPVTSNPVPGDIIVYSGHVAIYAGNGMAVHGGFNGNQTVLFTVECSNAFIAYVHPTLPN